MLRIDDPAFTPFRARRALPHRADVADRRAVRRVRADPAARRRRARCRPSCAAIEDGPGEGQHLLDVEHTVTPVGIDLINNIMRLPQHERLRLIINELGAGPRRQREALNDAVKRADPALAAGRRLVQVLAEQDQVLGRLVDESDARARARWPSGARRSAASSRTPARPRPRPRSEGDALEADLQKLPGFLRELRPAADRFGALADEMHAGGRQTLADAGAGGQRSRSRGSGPFSEAATPALKTLGDVADRGRRTFPEIEPLVDDLGALGKPLQPLASEPRRARHELRRGRRHRGA